MHKLLILCFISSLLVISKAFSVETIRIDFTEHDSYSIEVAKIDVGDTIEWLSKNRGHNVEFLAAPNMKALPEKSELDANHKITFDLPGVYLYQCTPHKNMGMIAVVVVDGNKDNLNAITSARVAGKSKQRLAKIIETLSS